MAERFTEFVLRLAQDPKSLEEFRRDPDASIKRAGLSPAEQTVLATGNPALIREAIATDVAAEIGGGGEAATEWVVVIVLVKSPSLEARSFDALVKRVR